MVGREFCPAARLILPEWVRSIHEQCLAPAILPEPLIFCGLAFLP
ncbi:hypothetical protein [Candidatus Methylacidiphilum fumarolicum]